MSNSSKHENYEILNLIGYGLSKYNDSFIHEFSFSSKIKFYNYCVDIGIANTASTIKNRMDLFDPFFPDNGRKGWWQKGNAYIHRKVYIDSLFGKESVKEYANIVKMYLQENFKNSNLLIKQNPIMNTRFKQLQKTGLEAELFFENNYNSISLFKDGIIEDARLYGDGYDYQISVKDEFYLAEVKGIREKKGKFRLTNNEYQKAIEYKDLYIVSVVLNLNEIPYIRLIQDPIKNLKFKRIEIKPKKQLEYHVVEIIC